MNEILTIEERINNVVDELERAIERLKEVGEFNENSITSDEELVNDMEMSLERVKEINDIVGLALIIAPSVGHKIYATDLMDKSDFEIEPDSIAMRENYLKWATEILPTCQEYEWEDYYDVAWTKADREFKKLLEEYSDEENEEAEE